MKVIIKTSVVLIALCMLAGTIMIFLASIKILFTRESAAYLSHISDANHVFSVLFFVVYVCLAVSIIRKISTLKLLLLSLVFILWLLCGRVVAFKGFPDGRIIMGWYYIETNKFNLCKKDDDCETLLSKESTVNKLSLWRVRINNKHVNKVLFVGPFTWHSCNEVFENHIGK